MGGNAIPDAKRVSNREFDGIKRAMCEIIPQTLGILTRYAIIPSYAEKESHGDMDILVCDKYLPNNWREKINSVFSPMEEPIPFVHNGPVTSFSFDGFQVDIILSDESTFDFSLGYFSYNDLGNLIGRIAHAANFKFGHDGLWYPVRNGTYKHSDILVTKDFYEAIEVLGFDVNTWDRGFSNLEEIFEFVASGRYFQSAMFPLEHRSHVARVRDAKRKTYTEFLKWIDNRAFMNEEDPRAIFSEVSSKFEHFTPSLEDALEDIRIRTEAKQIFNGEIVGRLTGLTGVELGKFMKFLRSHWPYCNPEEVITFTKERLEIEIMEDFDGYIKTHRPS